jgi:hypothetical protein
MRVPRARIGGREALADSLGEREGLSQTCARKPGGGGSERTDERRGNLLRRLAGVFVLEAIVEIRGFAIS